MPSLLIAFAWLWFCFGVGSGALLGLAFHREDWWGGYGSWRRRLARLGHIAFFGTGGLCLAAGLTMQSLDADPRFFPGGAWIGGALLVGSVAMPTVCFLSAWRKPLRHLFAIPVVCLAGGTVLLTVLLLLQVWKG